MSTPGLLGIPIVTSDALDDGTVVMLKQPTLTAVIGLRPLDDLELARREARWVVRDGMRDVLEWLNEEVGDPPVRSGVGARLVAGLKARALEVEYLRARAT